MAHYLIQASYTSQAVGNLVKNPQNRASVVTPVVEGMGGKVDCLSNALGEYDIVGIVEMPDNVSVAALSMAVTAGGALSAWRTTALLTMDEGVEAMKKAGGVGYRPPTS